MALPGNGTIPAVDVGALPSREGDRHAIMELVEEGPDARDDIMTECGVRATRSRLDMALGCSTNTDAAPARHRARVRASSFDLELGQRGQRARRRTCATSPRRASPRTSTSCDRRRAASCAVLSELDGPRRCSTTNALTVSGKTRGRRNQPERKLQPRGHPSVSTSRIPATGGLADSAAATSRRTAAVVKRSGRCAKEMLVHEGPGPRVQQRGRGHRRHLRGHRSSRATWWSSAMKARRAAPACAKCSARPRAIMRHRGWIRKCRAHHRRPLLRRDPRRGHRPRVSGSARAAA